MTTTSEPGLSAIMSERRRLINLAYRLLGSLADAEDVVQETYARWYAMSRQEQEAIASPGAWLTRVAGRVCLDLLGSARARRESYVGEWVPEPLPDRTEWIGGRGGGTADPADPADRITLDESVGMPGAYGQRSARPGGPARRRHSDGGGVRRAGRPDHADLGGTQPGEALALDGCLPCGGGDHPHLSGAAERRESSHRATTSPTRAGSFLNSCPSPGRTTSATGDFPADRAPGSGICRWGTESWSATGSRSAITDSWVPRPGEWWRAARGSRRRRGRRKRGHGPARSPPSACRSRRSRPLSDPTRRSAPR